MVDATVSNSAVSIALSQGESTTVPANEAWIVTITGGQERSGPSTCELLINGNVIGVSSINLDSGSDPATAQVLVEDITLTDGDTVSVSNPDATNAGCHIGGFKV